MALPEYDMYVLFNRHFSLAADDGLLERGTFLNETIRKHVCPLGCVFEDEEYHLYESLHEMHKMNA